MGVGGSVCVVVGVVTCGYAGCGCCRGCRWGVSVVKSGGCMCVCVCVHVSVVVVVLVEADAQCLHHVDAAFLVGWCLFVGSDPTGVW